jgi:hypothetical protein
LFFINKNIHDVQSLGFGNMQAQAAHRARLQFFRAHPKQLFQKKTGYACHCSGATNENAIEALKPAITFRHKSCHTMIHLLKRSRGLEYK